MRAASWPESIRDAEEVSLVDRVQQRDHRPLDDLDLQRADAPGIMHLMQFALGMMGEDEPSLRPIFAGVDPHCRRW